MQRNIDTVPSALSIAGANLSTSYQGGPWLALQGIEELEAVCNAAFDATTNLTSMSFRLVMSDDKTNIDPIATIDGTIASATIIVDHQLTASAGNSVRARLQVTWAALQVTRLAKYVRIEVKVAGGALKSGDIATASLNYGHV
jgi:hypothetical protein